MKNKILIIGTILTIVMSYITWLGFPHPIFVLMTIAMCVISMFAVYMLVGEER